MIWACTDTSSADTGSSQIDELGLERQRPGHADALSLAAGERGGEPVVVLRVEPDELHQLLHPRAGSTAWRRRGSPAGRR